MLIIDPPATAGGTDRFQVTFEANPPGFWILVAAHMKLHGASPWYLSDFLRKATHCSFARKVLLRRLRAQTTSSR